MQSSFWSWAESSRTQQAVCFAGQPAGGCAGVWENLCEKDMGTCSASQDKRLVRRKAPLNEWCAKWAGKQGERALSMKSWESVFFVDSLTAKCCPPPPLSTHSTPSRAHLPALREKAPCNPICWLLIHTLLSLPRAGSWAWVSTARNFGFHIESSQDGHLRNVSLHQNCLPSK